MKDIELKEMIGGALQEQFGKSFEKVVENLQNPNTPFKNSREITIKLKFTQNERRDDVKCAVQVHEKLAPQAPLETSFAIGKDLKTGELYAEEYGKQMKGQIHVDDVQSVEEINGVDVNMETGEILKKAIDNVVDFRRTRAMKG